MRQLPKPEVMNPGLHDVNLGELLSQLATLLPKHEALVYPELGCRWSFAELEQRSRKCAKGLLRLGIGKDERVALWAPNIPEWIVLFFGLAKMGAALVTVNTALRRREVEYLLRQSQSCVLILVEGLRDNNYVETVYEIVPELRSHDAERIFSSNALPHLRQLIFLGDEPPPGFLSYSAIERLGQAVPDEELEAIQSSLDIHDVVNIQYTSGTTGFPKGAMLTHHNIVNNGYWIGERQRFTPEDRLCLPVPLFHCFGCVLGILGAYTHGTTLVPLVAFDPGRVLETIQKERGTALYGVPTMFLAELEHPDFNRYNLSSLRTGIMAGSLCPEPLMRRVMREMHMPEITIAYGLTEASPVVTMTEIGDSVERRTQTVGKPLPAVEVQVADSQSQQSLPPGKIGELWVRGYLVMKGYYDNQKATREAITPDGWLRTGDLAVIDEDGYVTITGRIKDMIIRGGENIYPKEVEDFLRNHPKVSDVAVYGVPCCKLGEEVAAAIRLQAEATATTEEIVQFCKGRIASFKIPRFIQFVTEFPQTASGKIQKFRLRERALRDFPHLQEEVASISREENS